jgi:hypothetical protein
MADPKSLDEALRLLQADPPVLVKDKKGQVGNQKTKYADLVQVNAVVLSRLNALGVIYKTKPTLRAEEPKFVLAYSLRHVPSDTEETGEYPLKLSENPMQMGSAITYARRYVLLAITGIAAEDEDDDGQAAGNPGTVQRQSRRASARRSTPQQSRPPLPGEGGDGVTPPQLSTLGAQLGKCGISDRDERLRTVSILVGRPLLSSKALTKAEASTLIDTLEGVLKHENPGERLLTVLADAEAAAESRADEPAEGGEGRG